MIETDSIIDSIITYLSFHNKKITFAESCTGGALANRFISRPGASQIIDGSFITYSNEIKSAWYMLEMKPFKDLEQLVKSVLERWQ